MGKKGDSNYTSFFSLKKVFGLMKTSQFPSCTHRQCCLLVKPILTTIILSLMWSFFSIWLPYLSSPLGDLVSSFIIWEYYQIYLT